jgi:hypothetical protein
LREKRPLVRAKIVVKFSQEKAGERRKKMDVTGLNYKTAKGLMEFEERLSKVIEDISGKNYVRIDSSKKQLNQWWSSDSGNCMYNGIALKYKKCFFQPWIRFYIYLAVTSQSNLSVIFWFFIKDNRKNYSVLKKKLQISSQKEEYLDSLQEDKNKKCFWISLKNGPFMELINNGSTTEPREEDILTGFFDELFRRMNV